jgi:hypothetical protein
LYVCANEDADARTMHRNTVLNDDRTKGRLGTFPSALQITICAPSTTTDDHLHDDHLPTT